MGEASPKYALEDEGCEPWEINIMLAPRPRLGGAVGEAAQNTPSGTRVASFPAECDFAKLLRLKVHHSPPPAERTEPMKRNDVVVRLGGSL
jgi:hypothetical protein